MAAKGVLCPHVGDTETHQAQDRTTYGTAVTASQGVSHLSTNQTQCCLISLLVQELVVCYF